MKMFYKENQADGALFPLPLTCFEEYMMYDDRPSYPMTGIFRLRFSGFLQKDALEAAIQKVFERHPFLRATIDKTDRRCPKWIDHPEWRPDVQWHSMANAFGFPEAGYVDLTRTPGSRVWVLDRENGHDLILQVHHCCTDALGMETVFEDLLVYYAMTLSNGRPKTSLRSLALHRLRDRGTPGLTVVKYLKMIHRQMVGLLGVRQFLMRTPTSLTAGRLAPESMSPAKIFPTPLIHTFDRAQTRRILAAARHLNVTVNHLLVRDLFLAVSAWQKKKGPENKKRWLRFAIPMNLRTAVDIDMPMANSVSMIFLDRQPADFSDPEALLSGIQAEMRRIRHCRLEYTYILSLAASRMLPESYRESVADTSQTTSCFSNLGTVLDQVPLPRRDGQIKAGNVVLSSVDFVIPVRPHLNAAFCIYTYAGRLRVLMHFDNRALTASQAKVLLQTYVQHINRTVQAK